MTLTRKIGAATSAVAEGLLDSSLWLSGWTIVSAGTGIVINGLYQASVLGLYSGNWFEQASQGVVNTIPFVSNLPAYKVFGQDIVAAALGAGIYVGGKIVSRAVKAFKETHKEKKEIAKQKDGIDANANIQLYQARVDLHTQEQINNYRKRSSTYAED